MESANFIIAIAALSAVAIITLAALRGWQDWLALKERELEFLPPHRAAHPIEGPQIEGRAATGMARIEIADLKERIRRLEAIAAGVDL